MSKRNPNSSQDYAVGYGKPPMSGRFQKGDGGNRKGRHRRRKVEASTIDEVLNEPHIVIERGRRRRMPAQEVILRKQVAKAMGGDLKAAQFLLDRQDRGRPAPAAAPDNGYDLTLLSDEELNVVDRILSKASGDGSDPQSDQDA
jgi:Family of unknown function (DUF5681)